MKLAIEASQIIDRHKSGVGVYATQLTRQIAIQSQTDQITLTYFGSGRLADNDLALPNIALKQLPIPRRLYDLFFRYAWAPPLDALFGIEPDLYLFPAFVAWPTRPGIRRVVVIHDLAYNVVPETVPPVFRHHLARQVPRSIASADHIITVSQSTKTQLVDTYAVSADKITVVYPGVDLSRYTPRPLSEITAAKEHYRLPKKYLLFVGTLEPRKNLLRLIEAHCELPESLRAEFPLVLAGAKGWMSNEIMAAVRAGELEGRIRPLGYFPEADRPALISGASALVFPSLYEGFGIPPLEAMACGVPVISSDNSSLPEVVGEAGILINAMDTKALTDAMHRVLTDLKFQSELSQKGIQRAKQFTWQKSGEEALTIISKISSS